MQDALVLAKNTLSPPDVTCAVVQNGAVVSTGRGMGVKPLLFVFNNTPELLKGSAVADTVIGKAAAMLLIYAGAAAVYGQVMSRPAAQALEAHGILHAFGSTVPMITNRTGDGCCPLEQSVAGINDPAEAIQALTARIAALMQGR